MVFLINPNNPLGIVHSAHDTAACITWARARGIHVVVDEIYANSVYAPEAAGAVPFVTAVRVCAELAAGAGAAAAGEGGPSRPAAGGGDGGDGTAAGADGALAAAAAPAGASPALPSSPLGDYVHVLWGFSKDFCMSGYRVGVLHTANAALLEALGNVNYFAAVSNDTQDCLAAMISDLPWVDSFFAANRSALAASYESLAGILQAAGIPFVRPYAGMFVWLDLRRWLLPVTVPPKAGTMAGGAGSDAGNSGSCSGGGSGGEGGAATGTNVGAAGAPPLPAGPQWESERALTDALFREARLLFTPGEACHASEPGWYRCCFAWMPPDAVAEGFRRLAAFVAKRG
jgi:1-aminocyclopropane-1-carboxylate synthase